MIDLRKYIGKTVLVQLKQPYTFQVLRAAGNQPVPLTLAPDPGGGGVHLATAEDDPQTVQRATTDFIAGLVVERDGAIVLRYPDSTSGDAAVKIETELSEELILAVSIKSESRILM